MLSSILTLLLGFQLYAAPKTPWQISEEEKTYGSGILIGKIPGEYLNSDQAFVLGQIKIVDGVIQTNPKKINPSEIKKLKKESSLPVYVFKTGRYYDAIYPGLIDLHNHNKQNILPVWKEAKARFENRYEWRKWSPYYDVMRYQMNPWIQYDSTMNSAAAYRWTELQSMVLGTTYYEGSSIYTENFGIHRVSDPYAFKVDSEDLLRPAPYDTMALFDPWDFHFVWNTVRPKMNELAKTDHYLKAMKKGVTFFTGLQAVILEHCPGFRSILKDVSDPEQIKIISSRKNFKENCNDALPPQMERFVTYQYSSLRNKIIELQNNPKKGLITHVAEGRQDDPYNQIEFQLFEILGIFKPYVNFIHGVGLNLKNFKKMAKNKMGLIWSPFSNLILYGQTLDLKAVKKSKVKLALGSDWTPTGTKSVLEEVKIAQEYIKREKLSHLFCPKDLYEMMTKNSAQMINRYEDDPNDGFHGIGTIKKDAIGSLIVVKIRNHKNPYLNLIEANAEDIETVIIDGAPVYGSLSKLQMMGQTRTERIDPSFSNFSEVALKKAPQAFHSQNFYLYKKEQRQYLLPKVAKLLRTNASLEPIFDLLLIEPEPTQQWLNHFNQTSTQIQSLIVEEKNSLQQLLLDYFRPLPEENKKYVFEIAQWASKHTLKRKNVCNFEEPKHFVRFDETIDSIKNFSKTTHLKLNTYTGILKFLSLQLMNESQNAHPYHSKGNIELRIKEIPSLFTCNRPKTKKYFSEFLSVHLPKMLTDREINRTEGNLKSIWDPESQSWEKKSLPHQLAELYQLDYK